MNGMTIRGAQRIGRVAAPLAILVAMMAPSRAAPPRKAAPRNPGCLYGQVIDGHSGQIRCLSPEELTPPGPFDRPFEPVDAGADAADGARVGASGAQRDAGRFEADGAIPLRSVSVAIEGLSFESGEVPRAAAALERIKKDFARCIATEPGLLKNDAAIELRFLVRAPGKAEGVDVVQSRGMSADIARCVASSLAGRPVGAPTSDPVSASFTVHFKKD
jgi:hypothetical protein